MQLQPPHLSHMDWNSPLVLAQSLGLPLLLSDALVSMLSHHVSLRLLLGSHLTKDICFCVFSYFGVSCCVLTVILVHTHQPLYCR